MSPEARLRKNARERERYKLQTPEQRRRGRVRTKANGYYGSEKHRNTRRQKLGDEAFLAAARVATAKWRKGKGKDYLEVAKLRRHRWRVDAAGRPRTGHCEVCKTPGDTVWDHCHFTGKFRGWLCNPCNAALGMVKDDPARLRALADYLERRQEMAA